MCIIYLSFDSGFLVEGASMTLLYSLLDVGWSCFSLPAPIAIAFVGGMMIPVLFSWFGLCEGIWRVVRGG